MRDSCRLRVAHLIEGDQWAGAEVHVADLLAGLASHPELDILAIVLTEGRLAEELRLLGIDVSVVSERHLGRLGVVHGLVRALRRASIELLHTHGYKESILGAVAGRWAGVRCYVKTEHGLVEPARGWARARMSVYRWLDRWVARHAVDRVVAVSQDLYRCFTTSAPVGRVVLIRNGIDPRRVRVTASSAEIRRQLGIDESAPLLGTACRLVPVKGLDHLLRAARNVLDALPRARFLIVGDGPLRSDLERHAYELRITDAVQFLGFRRDVLDIINALDVFVMPSIHEGLPLALLEASALGKAIVASAVGGIPEVLQDGDAWLVPPGDVPALTRACLAAVAVGDTVSDAAATRATSIAASAREMWTQTCRLYLELARGA